MRSPKPKSGRGPVDTNHRTKPNTHHNIVITPENSLFACRKRGEPQRVLSRQIASPTSDQRFEATALPLTRSRRNSHDEGGNRDSHGTTNSSKAGRYRRVPRSGEAGLTAAFSAPVCWAVPPDRMLRSSSPLMVLGVHSGRRHHSALPSWPLPPRGALTATGTTPVFSHRQMLVAKPKPAWTGASKPPSPAGPRRSCGPSFRQPRWKINGYAPTACDRMRPDRHTTSMSAASACGCRTAL